MGLKLVGLYIVIISTSLSSAYHRYGHFRPRQVDNDYHYSDEIDHSPIEEANRAFSEASASAEASSSSDDEDHFHEEILNQPDVEVNDNPDNERANAPINNGYEVTEHVDDIPNPMTIRPIIANFSTARPLNFAGPARANRNRANGRNRPNKRRTVPASRNNVRHTHEDFYSFNDIFPDIQESLAGVTTSIAKGLNHIKKEVFKKVNDIPDTFFNTLHRKANDVVDKVNEYFDYTKNDVDEFETKSFI
ncbi:unnamed protein product [Diatraea saccharalis]|uniref:Uncharacterized protein n=1 Tax=Diatraea saccharalis TaxID=40085 RepID=A0A9N9WFQ9_9NEOP|nr:unnamed protein product [Diatraea saccharalis]